MSSTQKKNLQMIFDKRVNVNTRLCGLSWGVVIKYYKSEITTKAVIPSAEYRKKKEKKTLSDWKSASYKKDTM